MRPRNPARAREEAEKGELRAHNNKQGEGMVDDDLRTCSGPQQPPPPEHRRQSDSASPGSTTPNNCGGSSGASDDGSMRGALTASMGDLRINEAAAMEDDVV